jgi:CheY-like chemotaxis protein
VDEETAQQMQSRPSILLVEDDPDIVRLLLRVLARVTDGYDIVLVCDAAQILTYLRSRPVPLVLTDNSLLGMTGLQLTAAIKQAAPGTRVVLITGDATLQDQARAHGVDYYLPKPFQLATLEHIVRAVLSDAKQGEDRP